MASKENYEVFCHQYVEKLGRKNSIFKLNNDINSYFLYFAVIEQLKGKGGSYLSWGQKRNPDFKKIVDKIAGDLRFDHQKIVYLAQKAGAKVPNRVLREYPDIHSIAVSNGWDNLELPTIKIAHHRKETKTTPAREDPQDKMMEEFSKVDKKWW